MSTFFQRFKYSYDKLLKKYNFDDHFQKFLTPNNIRLLAYAFIITRLYRIYQQYFEEIILKDILQSTQKKQILHIVQLEKNNKINAEKLIKDYNIPADDYYRLVQSSLNE